MTTTCKWLRTKSYQPNTQKRIRFAATLRGYEGRTCGENTQKSCYEPVLCNYRSSHPKASCQCAAYKIDNPWSHLENIFKRLRWTQFRYRKGRGVSRAMASLHAASDVSRLDQPCTHTIETRDSSSPPRATSRIPAGHRPDNVVRR